MHYRQLGRTELSVSEIGVGGAQFGIPDYMGRWDPFTEQAQALVTETDHRALDLGYNYFDTAPGYGDGRSEEMVGVALAGRRSEALIATKISAGSWTPDDIRASVEQSLVRLRIDCIDSIQFHGGWYNRGEDRVVLDRGGIEAMERLRDEGKVRYLGFTCEGPSAGVERLIQSGRFDTMQVRYNLLFQHPSDFENDQGIIRLANEQSMGIILMRPLTSGVFQRLMKQHFPQISALDVGRLLLNYVLSDPYIDVALVGAREKHFIDLNNEISDDVTPRLDLSQVHYRFVHDDQEQR